MASFHEFGKYPCSRERLNTMEYGKASTFAPSLRRRELIRSGPEAFETLRCCRTSSTSCLEIVIDSRV